MSGQIDIQALRIKSISDSQAVAEKSRFGLFGYPLSTAVGDDGQYRAKLYPKDQSGKPKITARGVFTNPTKTGQLRKTYFSDLNTLAELKDEYIDPDRKLLQIQNKNYRQGLVKQQIFKPASLTKTLHRPTYDYTQQKNPEIDPKRNKQQDGRVRTKPRNIYTNIQATVLHSFFKPLPHLLDPYERAHQLQVQRLKNQKGLQAQAPFKPNSFNPLTFNRDILVFGQDVELKAKTARQPNLNIYKHETKWKDSNPGKKGYKKFFTPVTYIEGVAQQKQTVSLGKDKDPFKTKSVPKSIVSPSITMTNLKRSFTRSYSLKR